MFNWRTIVGAILLIIGTMNFYSVYVGKKSNAFGVDPGYTKITCLVWIGVGAFLLYRGVRKQE